MLSASILPTDNYLRRKNTEVLGPSDDDLIASIDWDLMEKLFPPPEPRSKTLIITNPIAHDSKVFHHFFNMEKNNDNRRP